MANVVGSMLRIAEEVVFVDPYFGPEEPRYRHALEAFLRAAMNARPGKSLKRIEVCCSQERGATEQFFRDACQRQLPRCIPKGVRVTIARLRSLPNGERLHNRYILTNLGGVAFGFGLSEGERGATDDIHILDRAQYEARWGQYSGKSAFDQPEAAVSVDGIA